MTTMSLKWEPSGTRHWLFQISLGKDEQGNNTVSKVCHFEFVEKPAHPVRGRVAHQMLREVTDPQKDIQTTLCGKYRGPVTGNCRHTKHAWCKKCAQVAIKLDLQGKPGVVILVPES